MKLTMAPVVSGATQRGFLLVTAVALIVTAALILAAMVYLSATDSNSGSNNLQSSQALFVAESGAEYEQRVLAQNLNWYRITPDPTATYNQNLGPGSFSASVQFPATILRTRMTVTSPPTGNNWIQVYSVGRFPDAGLLQIDEDLTAGGGGEFVQYTGRDTVNNRFTGITRAITVGGITGADGAVAHNRGTAVYPVTTLVTAITSVTCSVVPNPFQIAAHGKFLGAGTIDIEGEDITYTGASLGGPNLTLTGVQRSGPCATHNAGRPVTPLLINGTGVDYEAEIISQGTVNGAVRSLRKTVQR